MKYRVLLIAAVVVAVVSLTYSGKHLSFRLDVPPAHAHLVPNSAAYLGVFEPGVLHSYSPVEEFARSVRNQPNLVGYYSGWTQPFASSFAQKVEGHHGVPYVQISPTYASMSGIAAGTYDAYLTAYADSVRTFGHAVIIGFGHEMNAPWYSWGYGRLPPATFVAAWRHIVTLFRQDGADNVTWLWTINQENSGTDPHLQSWWPGKKYVNWIGIDGYYFNSKDTFKNVFGHTIDQVRKFTTAPVLLSETAVAPQAVPSAGIPNLFNGIDKYKMLGLVWFDFPRDKGEVTRDWRIEGNPPAEYTFQLGVASSLRLITP